MSPVLVPPRRHDPELMDRPDNPVAELEGALDDICLVNRYLRGSKIMVNAVRPFLRGMGAGETLSILDVGTGGADLPKDLVLRGRRSRKQIRVVGVDRDPVTVAYARRLTDGIPEIEIVQADAFRLPFPDASFDLVTASMFLHHFIHDDAVKLLAEFRRVARRAVVINDLRRHWVSWAFINLASRLTLRHPMFVHDAPLSVLRGFTKQELAAAAKDAGAAHATVVRRLPYRLLLTIPAARVAA
jgi:ubiquinone/menaquinone biosynthesis C-methylase UbiE